MTKQEKIKERSNLSLQKHNQTIRMECYCKDLILMSNGVRLTGKDHSRYYKIFTNLSDFWMSNIDNILLYNNISFGELRSIQASNITKAYNILNGSNFPDKTGTIP